MSHLFMLHGGVSCINSIQLHGLHTGKVCTFGGAIGCIMHSGSYCIILMYPPTHTQR